MSAFACQHPANHSYIGRVYISDQDCCKTSWKLCSRSRCAFVIFWLYNQFMADSCTLFTNILHICLHYNGVIMPAIASQITSLTIVYSTVYPRHRSKKISKLRATGLCARNHWWPVNSPHKGPVTRKMFPFDDVIMMTLVPTLNHVHNTSDPL